MQLFNRQKRKHDGGNDERNKKQKGHNGHYGGQSKTRKIANLIKALDEALEEDGMDQTLDFIGDEALNRCLDLRTSLSSARAKLGDGGLTYGSLTELGEQRSHDFPNAPKILSPQSLTPWKSSTIPTTFPPLPKVLDPTLEASAFIHIGCGSGRPTDLSYERLEWIGDAYLELIATLLISQTFPFFSPGKLSQIRERLVKNVTLAEFSLKYGFDKRLRLPEVSAGQNPAYMTKIMGDVFEAYAAAVILSDPAEGLSRVSQWLKDIWGMTLAKDIIAEERTGLKFESPLWKLRGSAQPVQAITSKTQKEPLNHKDQLQCLIGSKGVKISYNESAPVKKDPSNNLALFTVGVYLDGYGEKNKMLGIGQANGKKEAGLRAAEMAMANEKLMKIYADKKKLAQAQLQTSGAAGV